MLQEDATQSISTFDTASIDSDTVDTGIEKDPRKVCEFTVFTGMKYMSMIVVNSIVSTKKFLVEGCHLK